MVNPGGSRGFNPGEAAQPTEAANTTASEKASADAQIGEGRKALDNTQTAESTVGKFQLESGLFKSSGLNPQEFRRSTDLANGVTTVENKIQRFETSEGSKTGIVHTGKDGTVLTTREGERYGVTRGQDGRTTLTNQESGMASEVLSTRSLVKDINRPSSDIGPALVHREGRPNQEITQAQERANRQKAQDSRGGERGKGQEAGVKPTEVKPQGEQSLSQTTGEASNLADSLKGPELLKSVQKALEQASKGNNGPLDALSKQLGLDSTNPQSMKLMGELGQRLKLAETSNQGNVKLQDVLKGLDPAQAKSIESFLTQGKANGSELTLNQLDQGRVKALQTILDGNLGKIANPTDLNSSPLNQALKQIQSKSLNLEAPTAKVFGQNIQELGQQLKLSNLQGAETAAPRTMADLVSRSLDSGATANAGRDMIARLNPGQEQIVKTLIENSRSLSNLIETGKINIVKGMEQGQVKIDASSNIISDLVTRIPGSMQGNSFAVRGEVLGSLAAIETAQQFIRSDAAAMQGANIVTRPDGSQVMMSPIEILSGKPIDSVTGLPYDPHTGKLLDPSTGRVIGQVRPGETQATAVDKWESSKKGDNKSDFEEEKAERDKKKALILADKARKLKELKERELKEKAEKEKKRLQEERKRTKYVVKEGDTLESIAHKQLRDKRLAALIYDINKNIIPIVSENGKQVVNLRRGLVLWLPSPIESKEFKGKLMSDAPGSDTANSGKEYASPEEELAAKYGEKWSGNESKDGSTNDIKEKMHSEAVEESRKRKENIEKVLGPIKSSKDKPKDKEGRQVYVVRLGETLKSVAMKHPQVRDVTLWKLIAEINKLSTMTDAKGVPKAKLTRGKSIKIPSREEIEAYRDKYSSRKALSKEVESITAKLEKQKSELYICDNCGRMSVSTAKLCGCGKRINPEQSKKEVGESIPNRQTEKPKEAAPAKSPEQKPAPVVEDAKPQAPEEQNLHVRLDIKWQEVKHLDEITRLGKSTLSEKGILVYALEIKHEGNWINLLCYEIGASRTLRHDDFSSNLRKTVKIDLPQRASEELAKNDLNGNWKNYKRKFLRSSAS